MRSSTSTPRLIVSPASRGELDVGPDPAATSRICASSRRPSVEVTPRRRPLASTRLGLGLDQELEPEPFQVVAQDLGGARVELAAEQAGGALEHDGLQAELVQRVRRLEAEQAAAGDDRAAA